MHRTGGDADLKSFSSLKPIAASAAKSYSGHHCSKGPEVKANFQRGSGLKEDLNKNSGGGGFDIEYRLLPRPNERSCFKAPSRDIGEKFRSPGPTTASGEPNRNPN
jgi:hypothetical protein